ncbi:HesA/MoeB/ThiF family protein [Nonomuraea ferruginea]
MTLLDRDTVDPRNFARQYLYRWDDVGSRKVARAADWVRAFDPSIEVEAIDLGVESPEQLDELVGRTRPDVVASGIDRPNEIDLWVNAACVRHGVPFVRGGMWVTSGTVWSVAPGVSACRACVPPTADPDAPDLAAIRLYRDGARPNRGIGPVADPPGRVRRVRGPALSDRIRATGVRRSAAHRRLRGRLRHESYRVAPQSRL